jgi:thiol:disulfide interchange protein
MKLLITMLLLVCGTSAFAKEPCDDSGQIYKVCSDQKQNFNIAMAQAKGEKKLMLVVFGADWCPWCISMHRMFTDPTNKLQLSNYRVVEIGVYKGRDKDPAGVRILHEVEAMAKQKKKEDGIPALAVINPTNLKATFIDTAKLEKNTPVSKGHDPEKVWKALTRAKAKVI